MELKDIDAATRDKPIAGHTPLKSLIQYLFVCDEAKFQHERLWVPLALSMLIMVDTGSKPEAIMESMYYQTLNDELLYDDMEVTLVRAKRAVRPTLALTFRTRKNRRHGNQGYVDPL